MGAALGAQHVKARQRKFRLTGVDPAHPQPARNPGREFDGNEIGQNDILVEAAKPSSREAQGDGSSIRMVTTTEVSR